MVDLVRFLSQFGRNEVFLLVHNLVDHNFVYFLVHNLVYRIKKVLREYYFTSFFLSHSATSFLSELPPE